MNVGIMSKSLLQAVGFMLLLAQMSPVMAETLRIGYVDLNRALQQMPQAKRAADTLNRELMVRQREIDQRREQLRLLQLDYEKSAPRLNDTQKRERERQIQAGIASLQDMQRRAQEDLNFKRNQVLKALQARLVQVIGNIAQREGYTLVLHDKSVLYAVKSIDITDQVLAALRSEEFQAQKR